MATAAFKPDMPVSFGYKCAWYAVPTNDIDGVVSALGLAGAVTSTWRRGIEAAYSDKVFVTPPLGDWILAVGRPLFYRDNTPEKSVLPILSRLSTAFGEAQYFATHRVVEAHCWALARAGNLIRAYSYVGDRGEVTWNKGQPTKAELALGEGELGFPGPNEHQLMEVSGAWSVNPSKLGVSFTEPSLGRLGNVA